ncbi:MAG: YHS domain-containing protein [Alphaproteobacteria bacterium]|nr:YHS domain-containing protein [Alphaproteobacteria bacterium]
MLRSGIVGFVLIVTLGVGLFFSPAGAYAADEQNSTYEGKNGLAIAGFDVVAYARTGKAIPGQARYRSRYRGSVYAFDSLRNQQAFAADPKRYLPAYGGYCAYGVRLGRKSPVDPSIFDVVDGKVHLFLNQATKFAWEEDRKSNKKIADNNWSKMIGNR